MFAEAETQAHPRALSPEQQEQPLILPMFSRFSIEDNSVEQSDSDSSIEQSELKERKRQRIRASNQLQPWKATKTKESIRAAISPQSLDVYFKSICDQEAAVLAVIKRPSDHYSFSCELLSIWGCCCMKKSMLIGRN
jgi:hypothetical protein